MKYTYKGYTINDGITGVLIVELGYMFVNCIQAEEYINDILSK